MHIVGGVVRKVSMPLVYQELVLLPIGGILVKVLRHIGKRVLPSVAVCRARGRMKKNDAYAKQADRACEKRDLCNAVKLKNFEHSGGNFIAATALYV